MLRLAKRYHIHPLLLTIFFILILMVCSTLFGYMIEKIKIIQTFDASGYEFMQNIPHPTWLNTVIAPFNYNFLPWASVPFLSFLAVIVFITLGYIAFFRRKDFFWALFALALTVGFDVGFSALNPRLIFRSRPFLSLPNSLNQMAINIWKVWPSYPSGHTRDTALILTVLAAFLPKYIRFPFILFVIFIAFSRVYLGAHYPTDVLAGMFVGYFMGKIVLSVVEEIRNVKEEKTKTV